MTQSVEPTSAPEAGEQESLQGHEGHQSHGGHSWLMMACCLPMLVIAVALVATGVVGASFIFAAVACTVMMALMMRGHGGHK
jgi:hypothetical protein